jgi:molybdopterin molybdotransferase
MALIPVEDALSRILKNVAVLGAETIRLEAAYGRTLAAPLKARRDQPPFNASAMDGYAVKRDDVLAVPADLKVAGVSAAGHRFRGRLKSGEAVRIFTGAPVPPEADAIVIQENTVAKAGAVTILETPRPHQSIRDRGLDFKAGESLLPEGLTLNARDIGVAAAMNCATIKVRRKPVVAILATGDELVLPGERPRPDQIVSSNSHGLAAMVAAMGAEVINAGIVHDDLKATERAVRKLQKTDVLITTGGASVGDHDFIQQALKNTGVKIDFWKIAMRPGKPFMYGRRARQHVMGLPGNPVSALVCAKLFVAPLLRALQGLPPHPVTVEAHLAAAMKANDSRQDYVRATLRCDADGTRHAAPFTLQDSSMQRTFREAHCLIVRPPLAPEAPVGTLVPVMLIDF